MNELSSSLWDRAPLTDGLHPSLYDYAPLGLHTLRPQRIHHEPAEELGHDVGALGWHGEAAVGYGVELVAADGVEGEGHGLMARIDHVAEGIGT